MKALAPHRKANNRFFLLAFIVMLSMAFFQCFKTTHDLYWAADPDFDRDISFVRGTLDGDFGKDPNYKGGYLWYNPLLFSVESAIVKITSLPPNVVAVRAGAYLNLLGPVAFFAMAFLLFGIEAALACLLSFLFLATGNMLGWGAATYSPWLYPVCFTQFIFYINIILCFKAFASQKYVWFMLLGASVGICFLGHTAPALITILIMVSMQSQRIVQSLMGKKYTSFKKYMLQGIVAFLFFIIAAMPLLFYVVGKYHLHLINRATFEYTDDLFYLSHLKTLAQKNISVSFLVSIVGFFWFYKNFRDHVIRMVIYNWLFVSFFLYAYSTVVAIMDNKFHIRLPGTVPSFHYFFYMKAIQSVFFGFGLLFLLKPILRWTGNFIERQNVKKRTINPGQFFFPCIILLCAIIYFPFYKNRSDFVVFRQWAIEKQNRKDKIEVHDYIVKNISAENVILCEKDPSIFPVMATGRKMVSIAFTFSNPYLDFDKREQDRNNMLLFLKTGEPLNAGNLFKAYDVDFVLLSHEELSGYKKMPPILGEAVFKNNGYNLFRLNK